MWEWLKVKENRGTLLSGLQFLFGRFSILGIVVLAYLWLTREPEVAFAVTAGGSDTFTSSEERIYLEISNVGTKKNFAPENFYCHGDVIEGLDAKVELLMQTESDLEIAPEDVVKINYSVATKGTIRISADQATGIVLVGPAQSDIYQLFARKRVQILKCSVKFTAAKEGAYADFWFHASPRSADRLGFLGDAEHVYFKYPEMH